MREERERETVREDEDNNSLKIKRERETFEKIFGTFLPFTRPIKKVSTEILPLGHLAIATFGPHDLSSL